MPGPDGLVHTRLRRGGASLSPLPPRFARIGPMAEIEVIQTDITGLEVDAIVALR